MNNAQLINQTSGDVEYYTPPAIVEAARATLGHIDLDPASSPRANQIVKAAHIFTKEDDSLTRDWFGHVWMNHPFGRAEEPCKSDCEKKHNHHSDQLFGNEAWIGKLITEFHAGRVREACCITYACTSEAWFQPLLRHPQCFLSPRTNYLLPDGTLKRGVTKGSVVTYLGHDRRHFETCFRHLGIIKL